MKFQEFKVRRNPKCPVCGDKPTITQLIDYEQFCGIRGQETPAPASADSEWEITVEDLKKRIDRNDRVFILDVRNPEEFQICRIPGSMLLPLPELPQRFKELSQDQEMVIHCKSGMRSLKATNFLRQQGFRKIKNLKVEPC
jgi:adenylyltransferase/sulfurtransferase